MTLLKEASIVTNQEIVTSYYSKLGIPYDVYKTTNLSKDASYSGLPIGFYGLNSTPYGAGEGTAQDVLVENTLGIVHQIDGHSLTNSLLSRASENVVTDYPGSLIRARNRAVEGAGRRAEALVAVSIAEAKKTYNMIYKLWTRFLDWIVSILKSIKTFNIKELFNVFSDIWLEVRYGWRPLYGDIQNISKALKSSKSSNVLYNHGVDVIEPRSFESNYYNNIYSDLYNIDATINVKEQIVKSGFAYALERENHLADRLGLHISSMLETAWELIPFSFIIDWFINIGQLLHIHGQAAEIDPVNSYDILITSYEVSLRFRPGSNTVFPFPEPPPAIYSSMQRSIPSSQHAPEVATQFDLNWDQGIDLITIGSKLLTSRINPHR